MSENIKSYAKLFWQLLKTDLLIHSQNIIGRIVDLTIWVSLVIFIFSYVFPEFGMSKYFGTFYLVGTIVSTCIFNIWGSTAIVISDFEGNNEISHSLTLPLPSWLYFIKLATGYACQTIITTSIILPLGKIILGSRMSFENISIPKFILIFLSINFFIGVFTLFVTSIPKSMHKIESVWTRILFPLWILGGPEFPWQTINELSPRLATLCLFNPFLYSMEGIRAAVLGQTGFINFWICFSMVWFSTVIFGWLGIRRLKKWLDFV